MMGPGGFDQVMRQAKKMQSQMKQLQDEMGNKQFNASSGGGAVKVVCNGRQEIISIQIQKEIMQEGDVEMLQDLILTAVNEALRSSQEIIAKEMSKLTGGLNIPGLF